MKKILNPLERSEQGLPHLPESEELFEKIQELDYKYENMFWLRSGGDGENGEYLMYLLDFIFESKLKTIKKGK